MRAKGWTWGLGIRVQGVEGLGARIQHGCDLSREGKPTPRAARAAHCFEDELEIRESRRGGRAEREKREEERGARAEREEERERE
eukprot:1346021-Rhodomonas_salina.1